MTGTIIGIGGGLIGIIGLVYAFLKSEKRMLGICLTQPINLVPFSGKLKEKLSLTYDGTKIDNLYYVDIVIKNIGNRAIRQDDIEHSPIVEISEKCEILDSELYRDNELIKYDDPLQTAEVPNRYYLFMPLLNPNEEVVLRLRITMTTKNDESKKELKNLIRLVNLGRIADVKIREIKIFYNPNQQKIIKKNTDKEHLSEMAGIGIVALLDIALIFAYYNYEEDSIIYDLGLSREVLGFFILAITFTMIISILANLYLHYLLNRNYIFKK